MVDTCNVSLPFVLLALVSEWMEAEGRTTKTYLSRMRRGGEWGGFLELEALSRRTKMQVMVFADQPNGRRLLMSAHPPLVNDQPPADRPAMCLLHSTQGIKTVVAGAPGNHYEWVRVEAGGPVLQLDTQLEVTWSLGLGGRSGDD